MKQKELEADPSRRQAENGKQEIAVRKKLEKKLN